MELKAETQRHRLILIPCPFQGHINPMLQLATVLHSKGFSITIAHTEFNSPDSSSHPDFTFLSVPDNLPDHDISSDDGLGLIVLLNEKCKASFEEQLGKMVKQEDHLWWVIFDELMYFVDVVANSLKIPSIRFRTSSATSLLARSIVFKLDKEGRLPLPDHMLHDPVPGYHPLRFKDIPMGQPRFIAKYLELIRNSSNIKTASAIILNTMDCLENSSLAVLKREFGHPVFPIGPLHKLAPTISSSLLEEDTSCMAWLDKQEHHSVIYVSLGSVLYMDTTELTEMSQGLEKSNRPFLWVIRPGSIRGSQWIESLPEGFEDKVGERGCIVKWAPQRKVLAHDAVGGFWSHCGWNSTLESILEGVPMICRPHHADQKLNTRYVSHVWRVGLAYENDIERSEVSTFVRRLMVEKEGDDMRQRAKELKEKVEVSVGNNGTSVVSLNGLVQFLTSV